MPAAMVSQPGFPFDSIGSAADNGSNGGGSNVGIAVGATSSTSSSPEVKVRGAGRDRDSNTIYFRFFISPLVHDVWKIEKN